MVKVYLKSLGCPKNRVDAEHMLGIAQNEGHSLVDAPDLADVMVINTCAFINEAKEESIDNILQLAQIKERFGHDKKLIVTGCLAQRYEKELEKEIPEVDHFLGTSDYSSIKNILGKPAVKQKNDLVGLNYKKTNKSLVTQELEFLERYDLPRINTLSSFSAYMKISEGCDNACAFCIIPKLRGKQRSRSIEDLVKEATNLANNGVKELNLIGQDLTAYGFDLPNRPSLASLLNALSEVKGIRWIRQLYAYPRSFKPEYYEAFKNSNVVPYIDMPLQHGSANVLRAMRRGGSKERLSNIVNGLRENIPNLVLRTTMMVGFPGETDEDFAELMDFIKEHRFERLGAFKYSNEENTDAYDFSLQVPQKIKEERYDALMNLQKSISQEIMQDMIGTVHEAVVTGISEEHEFLLQGRLWSQSPEIDGITYISSSKSLKAGDIVKVKITQAAEYDLVGEVLED